MTALYDEYWLDIAYHLHIPPEQQDRMSVKRFHEAVQAVKQIREDAAK